MPRELELVLVVVLGVVLGLAALARRFPKLGWLQVFRQAAPRLSDAERAGMRRRANVHSGAQLILLGLVVPIGYVFLTVMFFNAFTPLAVTLVAAVSLLLVGLGVTAIWLNRGGRSRRPAP